MCHPLQYPAAACTARLLRVLLLAAVPAAAAAAGADGRNHLPRYIPLSERVLPGEPADDLPFHDLHFWLVYEFEDICRDFFCRGAYDNYHPLRMSCVVERVPDTIHACRFSVAASRDHVDPHDGRLRTEVRHWECPLPLPPGLPVAAFYAATDWQSGSSGRLFNPLPGSGRSMFDILRDCLP